MEGLLPAAPVFSGGTGSAIDVIGHAAGQLAAAGYSVTGAVLNPADWITIQQVKAVPDGAYLLGSPGRVSRAE